MLASCQDGQERTLHEFDALLHAARLRRTATLAKPTGHGVIDARAQ
jgi:hypothetical protein